MEKEFTQPLEWLPLLHPNSLLPIPLSDLKYKFTVKDVYDALEWLEVLQLIQEEDKKRQETN